jgi:DNA-binding response OmpR family regulator
VKVLLVEDHTQLADLTKRALTEDGYVVDIASDGQTALDIFELNNYDVVVLDIMLPEIDGIEVCKTIRKTDLDIPIIMLTARDGFGDRVNGLDSGADDYLVKPFSFDELSARIRALLRRGKKADATIIQAGDFELNPATKAITYLRTPLSLTAKEYTLLQYFMKNSGRVIPKSELLEHVWDMNYDGLSNVLETYVRYLRHKIRESGGSVDVIQTYRNLGYMLQK